MCSVNSSFSLCMLICSCEWIYISFTKKTIQFSPIHFIVHWLNCVLNCNSNALILCTHCMPKAKEINGKSKCKYLQFIWNNVRCLSWHSLMWSTTIIAYYSVSASSQCSLCVSVFVIQERKKNAIYMIPRSESRGKIELHTQRHAFFFRPKCVCCRCNCHQPTMLACNSNEKYKEFHFNLSSSSARTPSVRWC